jgi:hypothetical protein
MAAIGRLQRSNELSRWHSRMKKAAGNRRPLYSRIPDCLFGRLLPRRVERAGIVDFGDRVIAEA